mmetsp:Transcript_28510/g.90877  ORF Transcript_28510/g.90877 Transcript_28510/m.90877 type:complete len:207 (+) Transcript_28510:1972-2592(+)
MAGHLAKQRGSDCAANQSKVPSHHRSRLEALYASHRLLSMAWHSAGVPPALPHMTPSTSSGTAKRKVPNTSLQRATKAPLVARSASSTLSTPSEAFLRTSDDQSSPARADHPVVAPATVDVPIARALAPRSSLSRTLDVSGTALEVVPWQTTCRQSRVRLAASISGPCQGTCPSTRTLRCLRVRARWVSWPRKAGRCPAARLPGAA